LQVGTPANWQNGEDVLILNKVAPKAADKEFEKGYHEILPWFRLTPTPDLPEGLRRDV